MPSYGGAHGPDGSKKTGDQGQGSRDKDGGTTDKDRGGNKGKPGPRNDTTATQAKAKKAGVTPDHYIDAASSYRDRINDENNTDNSFDEDIGNLLGGLIGLDEEEPDFDLQNLNPNADWSLDPIQALASFAGFATGMPVGAAWSAAKWGLNQMGVQTPTINLGPDVFGGGAGSAAPTKTGGGGLGGGQKGGGTGNGGVGGLLPQHSTGLPKKTTTPAPTTPPPTTDTPPPQAPSKFPTPSQRFQSASYQGLGRWDFDPETQQVAWRPNTGNGLLPFVAA